MYSITLSDFPPNYSNIFEFLMNVSLKSFMTMAKPVQIMILTFILQKGTLDLK